MQQQNIEMLKKFVLRTGARSKTLSFGCKLEGKKKSVLIVCDFIGSHLHFLIMCDEKQIYVNFLNDFRNFH